MYLNRTLCDVLEEMRMSVKTLNFCCLSGLIEEAQSMGNRMEAKLEDIRDVERMLKERSELNKEIKKLEAKKEEMEGNLE